MEDWRIVDYSPELKGIWDEFVRNSRNGTFLFLRDYMDYHSDRFSDSSRLAFKGNRLSGLLPANLEDDGTLCSHRGLTYGGWILPRRHFDGADMLSVFSASLSRFREEGISSFVYKTVPSIYACTPSEEDQYALFRNGARLTECDLSAAVDLSYPALPNRTRLKRLRESRRLEFRIVETVDAVRFMRLVEACLLERHGVSPVHTGAEMALLRSRFPANIRMFLLEYNGEDAAGVCIYDTGRVAHCQYIASTAEGRRLNLLTPLHHYLFTEVFASRRYYDFGTCNQLAGDYLNVGLLRQKCSFGATGVAYNHYRIDL